MPSLLRSLVFASIVGLVALPAMADVAGAPDRSRGSDALQQANVPAGTGREDISVTGPDKSYSWDKNGVQQAAVVWLPDARKGPLQTIAQIAPALLMIVLVALGLTITFTSLRKDMKQRRRVVYRPRGPPRPGA